MLVQLNMKKKHGLTFLLSWVQTGVSLSDWVLNQVIYKNKDEGVIFHMNVMIMQMLVWSAVNWETIEKLVFHSLRMEKDPIHERKRRNWLDTYHYKDLYYFLLHQLKNKLENFYSNPLHSHQFFYTSIIHTNLLPFSNLFRTSHFHCFTK